MRLSTYKWIILLWTFPLGGSPHKKIFKTTCFLLATYQNSGCIFCHSSIVKDLSCTSLRYFCRIKSSCRLSSRDIFLWYLFFSFRRRSRYLSLYICLILFFFLRVLAFSTDSCMFQSSKCFCWQISMNSIKAKMSASFVFGNLKIL